MKPQRILILSGPNLNLLGKRDSAIYGVETLEKIHQALQQQGEAMGVSVRCEQYNDEGNCIDALQRAKEDCDGVVLNAGAYTHYSYALRDAIADSPLPCVEIHLSNIYNREDFRHQSVISPVCVGSIAGFGKQSYLLGLFSLIGFPQGGSSTINTTIIL